ncbi:MAG TPA: hypothetical protein VGM63_13110 [Mucilaginibacter sp.]|jgi:hypothetical protein
MQINRYDTTVNLGPKLIGRYRRDDEAETDAGELSGDLPRHGSYGNLLFDPRWKAKRNEIMTRDKGSCVICQSTEELQVHHRQYQFVKVAKGFKVPWDYPDHLLITLCKNCHQRGHAKFKVPILIL